jgi:5-methylcytosine-specific restriction endonuclease McrA
VRSRPRNLLRLSPILPNLATLDPSVLRQRHQQSVTRARWALVDIVSQTVSFTTEVVLHVRGDSATFDDGTPIMGTQIDRLLPHSFIRALIHDAERTPINASGRQRHPTTRQKRVVHERDRECVDCGTIDILEYDHKPDYAITGRTVVEELELRCGPCHDARHVHDSQG